MDRMDARGFLLKKTSYFSQSLPSYYNLESLIDWAKNKLEENKLNELIKEDSQLNEKVKYSNSPEINYILQVNKTKESYRPITLIHPLLYVDLVNLLTDEENWEKIKKRYNELNTVVNNKVLCNSLPFY